jgi:hypothetical protein
VRVCGGKGQVLVSVCDIQYTTIFSNFSFWTFGSPTCSCADQEIHSMTSTKGISYSCSNYLLENVSLVFKHQF